MRTSLLLAGICLLALLPTSSVLGHAELTEAVPGPDEVVALVPAELVARFSQDLRADRTSIELRDADGQTIATGAKEPDKARVQRMALPPLAPGEYEVRWVSYSAEDDELARGRYRFTVTEALANPSPVPCPSPSPMASSMPAASPSPTAGLLPAPSASPVPADPCASPEPVLASSPGPSASPSASPAP